MHAKAKCIVTFNLKDFPPSVLQLYGIEALLPDDFVLRLIQKAPVLVMRAAQKYRLGLVHPSLSVDEYLMMLEKQGFPKAVAFLREHKENI